MKSFIFISAPLVSAFGRSASLLGVQEDSYGLVDPASYANSVFTGSETYATPSNLFQRNAQRDNSAPRRSPKTSFLETTNFFTPFGSLQEAKSAQLRIEAADEARADKDSITRTKIEAFRAELESQVDAARKEKKDAQERLARKGGSSFVQTRLALDFASREFAKINEMQRVWKLNADRLGHSDLASVNEPSAALIDANSKVEADRKRMSRISAAVTADLEKVDNDAAIVESQQARLKNEMRQ